MAVWKRKPLLGWEGIADLFGLRGVLSVLCREFCLLVTFWSPSGEGTWKVGWAGGVSCCEVWLLLRNMSSRLELWLSYNIMWLWIYHNCMTCMARVARRHAQREIKVIMAGRSSLYVELQASSELQKTHVNKRNSFNFFVISFVVSF